MVNYHKLDHATLTKLIYSYLGDWINDRKRDVDAGKRRLKRTRHDLSGMSTDHADSRFRGLPPLAALALAAAAFALDRRRPPRRPVEAAN